MPTGILTVSWTSPTCAFEELNLATIRRTRQVGFADKGPPASRILRPLRIHLRHIELRLDLVERVIADLILRPHLQQRLALRGDDADAHRAVLIQLVDVLALIAKLRELRLQLAANDLGLLRLIVVEHLQARLHDALARHLYFTIDRIVVPQLQQTESAVAASGLATPASRRRRRMQSAG